MRVTVFVEGGGRGISLIACRRGFQELLQKVAGETLELRVTVCGSRSNTFRDFKNALGNSDVGLALLLVDSEAPVAEGRNGWEHLSALQADQWTRPDGATLDSAHLMVQCMETWLLADMKALQQHFGPAFRVSSLPKARNLEAISPKNVLDHLKRAAEPTPKNDYHKTRDGFPLLLLIDPKEIRARSLHAERFFQKLEECAATP